MSDQPSAVVRNLPTGDKRAEKLYAQLMQHLEDNAVGLPVFTVLGIVELMRATILRSMEAPR